MNKETPVLKIEDLVLLKQFPEEYFKKHHQENKSYSHLPHLADLPYDRRTTDPNKLAERYNECHNLAEETLYDVAYWESMSELANNEKKSIEREISSIEYKLAWANNMQGTLDNVLTDQKEMYNQEISGHLEDMDMLINGYFGGKYDDGYSAYLPEDITLNEAQNIKTILNNGKEAGYLTQEQTDTIKEFAQNLEEITDSLDIDEIARENGFHYGHHPGEYDFEGVIPEDAEGIEDWCDEMKAWTGELKTFADNYNLNNEKNPTKAIVENLWDVPQSTIDEWKEQSKQLKQETKRCETEADNYMKESEKAQKIRLDYIKEGNRTHVRYDDVANDNSFDTGEWRNLIQNQNNYNPDTQDAGSLLRTRQAAMEQAKKDYGKG